MVLRKLGQRTRATVEEEVPLFIAFTFSLLYEYLIQQAAYFEDESAGLDGENDKSEGGNADLDSDENKVCNFMCFLYLEQMCDATPLHLVLSGQRF
jgi:hypothetical protein